MKVPKFTDEQLEAYADNVMRDMTSLEMQLSLTLIEDRKAFVELLEEIEPLALQIISPRDNTFSRQVKLIKGRLQPKGAE